MPEASVLYSVTAAVVVGLVAWVAFVLTTAKEPWARATLEPVLEAGDDVLVEGATGSSEQASSLSPSSSLPEAVLAEPKVDRAKALDDDAKDADAKTSNVAK